MSLIVNSLKNCTNKCEHFFRDTLEGISWCLLPDGKYNIEFKDGEIVKCPLNKWLENVKNQKRLDFLIQNPI